MKNKLVIIISLALTLLCFVAWSYGETQTFERAQKDAHKVKCNSYTVNDYKVGNIPLECKNEK